METEAAAERSQPSPGTKWLAVIIAIAAFTLIMLSMGHMSAVHVADLPTVNELNQLQVAVEAFRLKYGSYPPSSVLLSNEPDAYNDDPKSFADLRRIWPRLRLDGKLDWSGGIAGFKSARLEGDQCLVYFLRGPNGEGFSSDPQNPCLKPAVIGEMRIGPFFDFPQCRLVRRVEGNPFPSYQDPYGKNVYAFFSSRDGEYTRDCPSLKVNPYFRWDSGRCRYYSPLTVQIISAGADGVFGPGGMWSPRTAAGDAGLDGKDDLSNFHTTFLGRPD